MEKVTRFDVLWKDVLSHTVEITKSAVKLTNHTQDKAAIQFWYDDLTMDELLVFLHGRCFPESRADCNKILQSLGLSSYNIWDILEKKHGVLYDDFVWIRFEGEDICYDDVKIR